jgi:hypothetical protein
MPFAELKSFILLQDNMQIHLPTANAFRRDFLSLLNNSVGDRNIYIFFFLISVMIFTDIINERRF